MSSKDRVLKSVFLVTVLSVIGKITGFFREASIAAYYGAGTASDAYFVAYTLPSILFFYNWRQYGCDLCTHVPETVKKR